MVEFDSSVYGGEAPIDGGPVLVALLLHYLDMSFQGFFIGDAATEDAPGKHAKLDFCHVQPTTVYGGVVKLQAFGFFATNCLEVSSKQTTGRWGSWGSR